MIVLAIDPGNEQSGMVVYDAGWPMVLAKGKFANDVLIAKIRNGDFGCILPSVLAIEHAQSFGAKVWNQVFDTTLWAGRFIEAWVHCYLQPYALMYRRDIKLHVTGSPRAKDGQVRQCLLERWGGKAKAIGTKKQRGPLYGITADGWAALAIAVTFADKQTTNSAVERNECGTTQTVAIGGVL